MKNKTSKETINIDIEVRDDDVITMRQEQNTKKKKKEHSGRKGTCWKLTR